MSSTSVASEPLTLATICAVMQRHVRCMTYDAVALREGNGVSRLVWDPSDAQLSSHEPACVHFKGAVQCSVRQNRHCAPACDPSVTPPTWVLEILPGKYNPHFCAESHNLLRDFQLPKTFPDFRSLRSWLTSPSYETGKTI